MLKVKKPRKLLLWALASSLSLALILVISTEDASSQAVLDADGERPATPPLSTANSVDDTDELSADTPIASIGQTSVTREELWDWVRANPRYLSVFGAQWGQSAALTGLIKDRLLLDAALNAFPAKPDEPPLVAQRRALSQYRAAHLSPKPEIATPDALRGHYERNLDRFGIPPMIRVRELFFPAVDDASLAAARTEANAVYDEIKAGAAMEDFAERFAPDYPSKRNGGDRGYRAATRRPQLQRVTESLEVGQVAPPIELPTGVAIIQLLGRQDGVPASFDDVQDAVRQHFLATKRSDLETNFYRAEGKRRGITILAPEYKQAWTDTALASDNEGL